MKKLVALILVLVLCLSLSVPVFAASVDSNQGGNGGDKPTSPPTGVSAVVALSIAACTAGGVGIVAFKKNK